MSVENLRVFPLLQNEMLAVVKDETINITVPCVNRLHRILIFTQLSSVK